MAQPTETGPVNRDAGGKIYADNVWDTQVTTTVSDPTFSFSYLPVVYNSPWVTLDTDSDKTGKIHIDPPNDIQPGHYPFIVEVRDASGTLREIIRFEVEIITK